MVRKSRLLVSIALLTALAHSPAHSATCTVPNSISNGQVADATKIMDNFNAVADCAEAAVAPVGSPTTGSLPVFTGPNSVSSGNLSGDVTTSGSTITTLANSGVTAGTYTSANIVVDSKGRITSAGNGSGGGGGVWWFSPPIASSFNVTMMDNLTMSMVDDADVGLLMSITPTTVISGSDSGQYMGKSIGSPSADWEVKVRLEFPTRPPGNFTRWGLALSNAAKNKRVVFGWDSRGVVYWGYMYNPNGYGGAEQQTGWSGGGYPHWLRIVHVAASSTINFYAGQDGKGWTLIRSMADTDWLGETPKYVGVGFDVPDVTAGFDLPMSISYWNQSW
jgi:hypothetical protein